MVGRAVRALLCRALGHDLDRLFTQPDPRFEAGWSDHLHEPILLELFDHDCLRCDRTIRVSRWTRRAAAQMLRHEDLHL